MLTTVLFGLSRLVSLPTIDLAIRFVGITTYMPWGCLTPRMNLVRMAELAVFLVLRVDMVLVEMLHMIVSRLLRTTWCMTPVFTWLSLITLSRTGELAVTVLLILPLYWVTWMCTYQG